MTVTPASGWPVVLSVTTPWTAPVVGVVGPPPELGRQPPLIAQCESLEPYVSPVVLMPSTVYVFWSEVEPENVVPRLSLCDPGAASICTSSSAAVASAYGDTPVGGAI